jgi:hypothetical protein
MVLRPLTRRLLPPLSRRIAGPISKRVDELSDLVIRLDRHLPLVENAMESQNAELRSWARRDAEFRAELQCLRDELLRTRRELEALREDLALGRPAEKPLPVGSVGPDPTVAAPVESAPRSTARA